MNAKDFQSTTAGKVITTPTGYAAFVPAKLPSALTYDTELVLSLSRADAALSELSGLGRHLPNPHLLIAPTFDAKPSCHRELRGQKPASRIC